jgi:hypothetical protein
MGALSRPVIHVVLIKVNGFTTEDTEEHEGSQHQDPAGDFRYLPWVTERD